MSHNVTYVKLVTQIEGLSIRYNLDIWREDYVNFEETFCLGRNLHKLATGYILIYGLIFLENLGRMHQPFNVKSSGIQ